MPTSPTFSTVSAEYITAAGLAATAATNLTTEAAKLQVSIDNLRSKKSELQQALDSAESQSVIDSLSDTINSMQLKLDELTDVQAARQAALAAWNEINILNTLLSTYQPSQGNLPVSSSTTTSSLSWNSANYGVYELTAQSGNLTILADSASTPVHGQRNIFSIKCSSAGTFNLTYNVTNGFKLIGVTLPTSLIVNNYLYLGCIYNSNDSGGRWHVIAVRQGA